MARTGIAVGPVGSEMLWALQLCVFPTDASEAGINEPCSELCVAHLCCLMVTDVHGMLALTRG